MLPKYQEWIDQNVPADCLNKCVEVTIDMATAFPELKRVPGEVFISSGYMRPHWWMETAEGEIIDPTKAQFSSNYYGPGTCVLSYHKFDNVPTGKCPNCGEYCYNNEDVHDGCRDEYTAYLMSESC